MSCQTITYIAVDFDGTIVEHEFPDIGPPVPGAIESLKRFQDAGVKIILWTTRSNQAAVIMWTGRQ